MKEWSTIEQLLKESLAAFLGKALPEIGGERWWKTYVLDILAPAQAQGSQTIDDGDLAALDLLALVRVAKSSASELRFKMRLGRDFRDLLFELGKVRNRNAHASVRGPKLMDQFRDCDTVVRVMHEVGAGVEAIEFVESIRGRLVQGLAEEHSKAPAESKAQRQEASSDRPRGQSSPHASEVGSHHGNRSESSDSPDSPPPRPDLPATRTRSDWMISQSSPEREVVRALGSQTYIGIDFGTSTTVVSMIRIDGNGRLSPAVLPIDQPAEGGGTITHHLVNSVLAWRDGHLLFGRDAYRLRQELFEGTNVFSSFKMRLGINVGPTYPATALRRGVANVSIVDAGDATREFFKLLHMGIKRQLDLEDAPQDFRIAVTVPASFEANQRRDLFHQMKEAGLPADEMCLIDEPNAAFLSFLHASAREERDPAFLRLIKEKGANILVYDFGAGTCDVSILEVGIDAMGVRSRNRAISRFLALGGDDIDRAIAKTTLLPQLLKSAPDFEPMKRDMEERLIPRLQPVAERLKVGAIKWLDQRGVSRIDDVRRFADEEFTDLPVNAFIIRGSELSLPQPKMLLGDFADALVPFVGIYDPDCRDPHVIAPVMSALEKSGLEATELDAVLFVGGSAENPIVRNAVMSHLPRNVRAIVPADLRSHVSLGAALHSFGFHAKGMDLVKPITSETIYVIARGGRLEAVIPASTEVPTTTPFRTQLRIDRPEQSILEIPICVGSEAKLLGLLRINAPTPGGFRMGELVVVTASITHDKLLEVEASAGGRTAQTGLLNPLANRELTPAESRLLEARQKFNEAVLAGNGRPRPEAVEDYAKAAERAEEFDLAAEMYKAADDLLKKRNDRDSSSDRATSICYALSRNGDVRGAREWAERAYERDRNATTAYNLSVFSDGDGRREELLREALRLDDSCPMAHLALGRLLKARHDARGLGEMTKAMRLLEERLDEHGASRDDCRRLVDLARELGEISLAKRAQARLESLAEGGAYEEDNLAAALEGFMTQRGR